MGKEASQPGSRLLWLGSVLRFRQCVGETLGRAKVAEKVVLRVQIP